MLNSSGKIERKVNLREVDRTLISLLSLVKNMLNSTRCICGKHGIQTVRNRRMMERSEY